MKYVACGLLLFASAVSAQRVVEKDIAAIAIMNYTTPSLGEFDNQAVIAQSNRTSAGVGGYYEMWRYGNGLILGGSFTATASYLLDKSSFLPKSGHIVLGIWKLQRYKLDAVYEHRFRGRETLQPYLGLGGFLVVLWGGPAPAHSNVNHTGWDAWGGVIAPVGVNMVITPRVSFKAGVFVDIGKATTYGDTTYTASQNLMFEPQIGLILKMGRGVK